MKKTVYTFDFSQPAEERPQRPAKKKKKKKWGWPLAFLCMFILSFAITSLALRFSGSKPVTEPVSSEPTETEKVEIVAPTPVTDPRLPTILKDQPVKEEPVEEDPVEEEPTEEDPTDEEKDEPAEGDEPVKESEPLESETRSEGLR